MSARLVTTLGVLSAEQVGWMLAHEHVFANFNADDDHTADPAAVVARMTPELLRARASGITALVDATAVGAARRPDVLLRVSQAADLPILIATGAFKEPAKSRLTVERDETALTDWMARELTDGIDGCGVRAGWIKLSVTDTGITPAERTLLRAAATASRATGAVVGSHTVGAALANEQLDLFLEAGGAAERFIWIHTQTEPNAALHESFARRGAWIEYDAIDEDRPDAAYCDLILRAVENGYADHVLLSHDRTGYHPALPEGGIIKPYTYLPEQFVPKLRARGLGQARIDQLLRHNPFRAYARPSQLTGMPDVR